MATHQLCPGIAGAFVVAGGGTGFVTGVLTGTPPVGAGYVVTGLVTGCAPGTVMGAGVVTGLLIGTVGLLGFVEGTVTGVVVGIGPGVSAGFVGVVTVTGLVEGTVTIVGVGLFGGRETGVVEGGTGNITSCAVFWTLLRSSLRKERKICSLSPSAKSPIVDTSTYNAAILVVISVFFSKDFSTLAVNSANSSVALGTDRVFIVKTMGTLLQGRVEVARLASAITD